MSEIKFARGWGDYAVWIGRRDLKMAGWKMAGCGWEVGWSGECGWRGAFVEDRWVRWGSVDGWGVRGGPEGGRWGSGGGRGWDGGKRVD